MHATKVCNKICVALHFTENGQVRLNEIKDIRHESWTRKKIAVRDIIEVNWQKLNMDFDTRLSTNSV